jgi:hypothetical protein
MRDCAPSTQQCICVKRGLRVIQRFRIFSAFAVGDSTWLRKPRSNANTHVVCHAARQADRVAPARGRAQTQRATGQADPQRGRGTLPCRATLPTSKASQ